MQVGIGSFRSERESDGNTHSSMSLRMMVEDNMGKMGARDTLGNQVEARSLAANNLWRIDAFGRVPRIYDQLRLLDNGTVVISGMVGHD